MSAAGPSFVPHEAPVSGAQLLVGYQIDLTDPLGTAVLSLDLAEKHQNRNGTLHGGIHAMLLDAAAGFAASRHLAGRDALIPVQTLSLTTQFVASVSKGQMLVRGRVTGGGYKIIYASAEMCDDTGRVVSTAMGVFKRVTI